MPNNQLNFPNIQMSYETENQLFSNFVPFLSLKAHLAIRRKNQKNAIEWLTKEFQVAETNLDVLPTQADYQTLIAVQVYQQLFIQQKDCIYIRGIDYCTTWQIRQLLLKLKQISRHYHKQIIILTHNLTLLNYHE
ncbi:hypothetical protein U1329_01340 [Enterococcus cecorum]|uniref:Uncharacterized protein n=2 Tax=Enterococcus cecorum TaxID=44008 RepID=A0A0J0AUK9_9ENTE|nr:hypothetical protein [Enterococcus cecorum]KLO69832.1 hypothetical protein AA987_08045 [Enterococcus cecorum]MCJ0522455.1 hypothetical protein [Enterococcus cecorum]MCJ0559633.1 hypothetical protein [Enterococcus cecorum]MCJ0599481.1 hypothetical protein [Enterococcus cecorum]MCJ0602552.1 hypothetical protein [Enterococcus cecorum]